MSIIRFGKRADAAAFIDLFAALDTETEFMFFEPGERQTSVEHMADRLDRCEATGDEVFFVATDETKQKAGIIGFVVGWRSPGFRSQHVLHIVIGLRQIATGQGLGRQLMDKITAWAVQNGIHRLELTVMENNLPAQALYSACGFGTEGIKHDAVRLRTGYINELTMARLLDD
ncbi:MAG: GNAT family N-acetyltransferase [Granulosicoccus sp.]